MRNKYIIFITLLALNLYLFFLLFTYLPSFFIPNRWLDIKEGMERDKVHLILGTPEFDMYHGPKQLDYWDSFFKYGVFIMEVVYDGNGKVVNSEIKTHFEFNINKSCSDYQMAIKKCNSYTDLIIE